MKGHRILRGSKEYHTSVLLKEAIDALIPTRLGQDGLALAGQDNWYLDCTLGDGGHSLEIIKRGGRVLGVDVDPQALERVRKRFKEEGIEQDKFRLIQSNFRDVKNSISMPASPAKRGEQADTADQKLDGAIFDLGVSSLQLEDPLRGFSISREGLLDMRMDPTVDVTALDLINAGGRKELDELFKNLGEEKYSKRLADIIVSSRQIRPIRSTKDLAELVVKVLGRKMGKIHPATRVFQALRIAVNDELNALKEGLDQVKDLIKKNGYIVVISFHSLEDRIVKNTFREWGDKGLGEILTKKPLVPSEGEVWNNPRSRSAKMRVFKIL